MDRLLVRRTRHVTIFASNIIEKWCLESMREIEALGQLVDTKKDEHAKNLLEKHAHAYYILKSIHVSWVTTGVVVLSKSSSLDLDKWHVYLKTLVLMFQQYVEELQGIQALYPIEMSIQTLPEFPTETWGNLLETMMHSMASISRSILSLGTPRVPLTLASSPTPPPTTTTPTITSAATGVARQRRSRGKTAAANQAMKVNQPFTLESESLPVMNDEAGCGGGGETWTYGTLKANLAYFHTARTLKTCSLEPNRLSEMMHVLKLTRYASLFAEMAMRSKLSL